MIAVIVANFLEPLWVVCDYAVNSSLNAPFHQVVVVDRPYEKLSTRFANVPDEVCANGTKQHFLQPVTG